MHASVEKIESNLIFFLKKKNHFAVKISYHHNLYRCIYCSLNSIIYSVTLTFSQTSPGFYMSAVKVF